MKRHMKPKCGDCVTIERTIQSSDVESFAELSMDRNKIHFDEEFASGSLFGKPIAHGLIAGALISGGLTKLMGDGNIWLSLDINFKHPAFVGNRLIAKLLITDLDRRGIATIDVLIKNEDSKSIISGTLKSMLARI